MICVTVLSYSFQMYITQDVIVINHMRFRIYNPIALTPTALVRSVTKCPKTENAKSLFSLFQKIHG